MKSGEVKPLSGILYCDDCGSRLNHSKADEKHAYYVCGKYKQRKGVCTSHSIRVAEAEKAVLKDIRRVVNWVNTDEKSFIEAIAKATAEDSKLAVKKAKSDLRKAEDRVAALDKIIARTYEDNVAGKISDERFTALLGGFENEQAGLKAKAAEFQAAVAGLEERTGGADKFIKMAQGYKDFQDLTPEIVREFIVRVNIGQCEIVDGVREQLMDIVYNYIGAVPMVCGEIEAK